MRISLAVLLSKYLWTFLVLWSADGRTLGPWVYSVVAGLFPVLFGWRTPGLVVIEIFCRHVSIFDAPNTSNMSFWVPVRVFFCYGDRKLRLEPENRLVFWEWSLFPRHSTLHVHMCVQKRRCVSGWHWRWWIRWSTSPNSSPPSISILWVKVGLFLRVNYMFLQHLVRGCSDPVKRLGGFLFDPGGQTKPWHPPDDSQQNVPPKYFVLELLMKSYSHAENSLTRKWPKPANCW